MIKDVTADLILDCIGLYCPMPVILTNNEIGEIQLGEISKVDANDPERQYSPLVLAQTAKAMNVNAKIYYLGQGLRVLRPGEPEK